ncbi:MAG: tRNA (N(6)-L-threonylcarbamoyladenosine(37)-C(2))-methylthiotransferase MtaB [Turneriella sp.]
MKEGPGTQSNALLRVNGIPPRTALIHFGCRLNQFESDGIKAALADNHHTLTQNLREADFVVINTCTVTNKADYKNRAAIRRAHRLNPQAKIVVTGCYATTDAEELRALPGVYRVVSNDQKHRIAEVLKGGEVTAQASNRFFFSANHDLKSRATLKIQDGCNKSCSYCKIPQARGRGVSREFGETLDSARELIDAGFGELVLTGVNIGWYEDQGKSFPALVEALLDLPGNFHLRISSIEPGDVNERFAAFYQHPKMARFLHIPLQSGSKLVLKIMRRGYTPENFMRRIEHVRSVCPEVHIGTDVIVGFPAEGEAEFRETLELCRAAEFANIHIFPFSKRRNTPIVDWLVKRAERRTAPAHGEQAKRSYKEVNGAIIRERSAALAALKKEMADAYIESMQGQNLFAVAERIENGRVHFLTENYLRGVLPAAEYPTLRRGQRFQLTWSRSLLVPEKRVSEAALTNV